MCLLLTKPETQMTTKEGEEKGQRIKQSLTTGADGHGHWNIRRLYGTKCGGNGKC